MNDFAAQEEQRKQYQQGGKRRHQGTRKGLVDRVIHDHFGCTFTHLTEIFTNTVKHHNGIVQRVTDNGQQCSQHRQVKFDLQHRKHTERNNDIVNQRRHRTKRKAVLETQGHIDEDANQCIEHGQAALLGQFFTNLRTDKLNPAHFRLGIGVNQGSEDIFTDFGAGTVCPWGNADQYLARATEVLNLYVAVTRLFQQVTDSTQVNRIRVGHLDQRTAGKIDTESETAGKQGTQ